MPRSHTSSAANRKLPRRDRSVADARAGCYEARVPAASPEPLIAVAHSDDLGPGRTKKFVLHCGGREIEAFVVNHAGAFYAFVNRCCHIPMTMDWIENQFLTDDAAYIQCATHGALYEPASGECVAGPPIGQCLTPVPLVVRDGMILASCPDGE
jgi:nitrite reductase/ring-hydroxylating ferredoxin subunit